MYQPRLRGVSRLHMVASKAKSVAEYLKQLPPERREAVEAVRTTILKNLPKGYEETMGYGMIGYVVPLKLYPRGYLDKPDMPLPYAGLASQKNYMSLYLMAIYADSKAERWFRKEYRASGKKLDMGKSCVRFKKLDDLPLDLIGKAIAYMPVKTFIGYHEKYRNRKK